MILWIDAHLPPTLVTWLCDEFEIEAYSMRRLGLRDATDAVIFAAARDADAIVMTKDADFLRLIGLHGSPPRVLLISIGNTSNESLRAVLASRLPRALELFAAGESVVEIVRDRE